MLKHQRGGDKIRVGNHWPHLNDSQDIVYLNVDSYYVCDITRAANLFNSRSSHVQQFQACVWFNNASHQCPRRQTRDHILGGFEMERTGARTLFFSAWESDPTSSWFFVLRYKVIITPAIGGKISWCKTEKLLFHSQSPSGCIYQPCRMSNTMAVWKVSGAFK